MTEEEMRFQIFCAHLAAGNDVEEALGLTTNDLAEFKCRSPKPDCAGTQTNTQSARNAAPLFGVPVDVARTLTNAWVSYTTAPVTPGGRFDEVDRASKRCQDAILAAESREVPGWLAELILAAQHEIALREYGPGRLLSRAVSAARAALGTKLPAVESNP